VLISYGITHTWFSTSAEIWIWLNLSFWRFTVNAFCRVPLPINLILNSKYLVRVYFDSKSEVLRFPKLVLLCTLYIFNCLLNDYCLWESDIVSLRMDRKCSSVWNTFLAITESMVFWIHRPLILTILLSPCWNIAVSLCIHSCCLGSFFKGATCRVNQIFRWTLDAGGNTIFEFIRLYDCWQIITSLISFTQWFTCLRLVFAFFDVIEFICKTI